MGFVIGVVCLLGAAFFAAVSIGDPTVGSVAAMFLWMGAGFACGFEIGRLK
jgi:hypothetical protein